MRPETLGLGHGDDGRGEGRKPLAREFLIGDLAQERVGVHAAVSPRPAARGQRVEPVSEVQELNENVSDENSEPSESECGDFEEYEEDEELGMEMSM